MIQECLAHTWLHYLIVQREYIKVNTEQKDQPNRTDVNEEQLCVTGHILRYLIETTIIFNRNLKVAWTTCIYAINVIFL